ncbi:NVEALA domain-containing protein [Dysgonomonas mossii]|uniref:NVEALA domain-containing protein n=1 Tax=Dysgonomonas mossii TaxID=163665 RepID=UPI0039949D44
MSDLAMANVEALAQNEGGITECVGCVVTSNNLCKTFGDWGACVGESDGTVKDL